MSNEQSKSSFARRDGLSIGMRECNAIILELIRKDESLLQEANRKLEDAKTKMPLHHRKQLREDFLKGKLNEDEYSMVSPDLWTTKREK